ncbi:hypothetical protein SNE40_019729 [Patella caerulea]|uniref:Uncharacterized protein n=1 Tax=Patella caerulea TaxID=87958 RepID=A0AAN8J6X8_PATCE
MDDNVLFGEHYNTHFDPDVYVQSFFTVLEGTVEGGLAAFVLKALHDVFKSGDVKGTRLLDIGTGPSPHSVIPAVPFVQDIYLTDFSAINRKYLYDALLGSGNQDYANVYDFFANLDDKSEPWRKLSDDLKAKVCGIFPCNLLQDDIFGGSSFPLFDVITSSLCIEAAAPDVETYGNIAKKISKYLKVGGHMVIVGVLDQNYYIVGEHKFFSVSISEQELKSCWEQAGFTIQNWNHLKGPEESEYADLGSVFVMHCVKNS